MVNFQNRFFNMIDPGGNKHRLIILPQKIAEETFSSKTKLLKPTALISIVGKTDVPANIRNQQNLWMLRLRFDDYASPHHIDAPQHKNFYGLRHFIHQVRDFFCITVHCGAGLSRSAGVALAICQYLGWTMENGEDVQETLMNRGFSPNMWVYVLAQSELRRDKV